MTSFAPVIFAFAVLGILFLYGYLTDPNRPRSTTVQPAHGEASQQSGMNLQHSKIA